MANVTKALRADLERLAETRPHIKAALERTEADWNVSVPVGLLGRLKEHAKFALDVSHQGEQAALDIDEAQIILEEHAAARKQREEED